jgi:hypothetical protein
MSVLDNVNFLLDDTRDASQVHGNDHRTKHFNRLYEDAFK